jgi:hypothetical protein
MFVHPDINLQFLSVICCLSFVFQPVARAAAIDHNPGGGHWLHSGLSPQVIAILPFPASELSFRNSNYAESFLKHYALYLKLF